MPVLLKHSIDLVERSFLIHVAQKRANKNLSKVYRKVGLPERARK